MNNPEHLKVYLENIKMAKKDFDNIELPDSLIDELLNKYSNYEGDFNEIIQGINDTITKYVEENTNSDETIVQEDTPSNDNGEASNDDYSIEEDYNPEINIMFEEIEENDMTNENVKDNSEEGHKVLKLEPPSEKGFAYSESLNVVVLILLIIFFMVVVISLI